MKKITVIVSAVVGISLGIFIGLRSNNSKDTQDVVISDKQIIKKQLVKQEGSQVEPSLNSDSKNNIRNVFSMEDYQNDEYLKELLDNKDFISLLNETKEFFKESKHNESIAVWTALGLIMDSSLEYGKNLEKSLQYINEDSEQVLVDINNALTKASDKHSFFRQQMINLVGSLDIEEEKKINFFTKESTRKVVLDETGNFSPDSMNITNSIAFLRNTTNSLEVARTAYLQSIENNEDPKVQEELKVRFESYFPGSTENL